MRLPTKRPVRAKAQVNTSMWLLTLGLALLSCHVQGADAPEITLGNGSDNHIMIDGLSHDGRDFSIPEVKLAHAGWVVLHPFRDGRPVGEIYAGATWLPAGIHQDVVVRAQTVPMPEAGTPFLVMLHSDVNEDQTFDFVFVDERNVADRAVFEGNTMVAHIFQTP